MLNLQQTSLKHICSFDTSKALVFNRALVGYNYVCLRFDMSVGCSILYISWYFDNTQRVNKIIQGA